MQKLRTFPHPALPLDDRSYISLALDLDSSSAYSEKDAITLSNFLKEAAELTADAGPKWQQQLDLVKKNARLLLNNTGSLLLFINEDDIVYYHIDSPVSDKLVFGTSPYLKYLIQYYQFNHDYELLVLNQDSARLFDLGLEHLEEITQGEWPIHLTDALGEEKVGGQLTYGTYGSRGGSDGQHSFHGHNETSSEKEIDRENFFRYVDKYLVDNHGQNPEPPLLLFALPDNLAVFRKISKYHGLSDHSIESSAAKLTNQEIAEQAQTFIKKLFAQQREDLIKTFQETSPANRLDQSLDQLARVAADNRIESLIIASDLTQTGSISDQGDFDGEQGNFLKQLITRVLNSSGKVYILDADQVPEELRLSARLRY